MSKMKLLMMAVFAVMTGGSSLWGQNQLPAYVGSQAQFRDYLMSEMYYPPEARDQKKDAEIKVLFTVTASGEVVHAKATGEGSELFGKEAVRLIRRAMWNPGLRGGKPVDMATSVDISFSLKKYQRHMKRRGYDFPTSDSLQADTSVRVYDTRQTDSPATPMLKPGVKFTEYLARNQHYPESARKQNISGKVKVRFVVEPAGYAAHFRVEQHVSGGCTEEALRLLNEMKWKPAVKNGKAVRSWYFMSFGFGSGGNDFQYFPANQGGSSMN